MEISPATERNAMTDVAMARSLVQDIGGRRSVKVMLFEAYRTLTAMFPHNEEPRNQWTERRLRAFWNMEAATVQYREMVELHEAAAKKKAERALIAQAREEHAAFIEKTARLRSLLEHSDAAFHSPQIEGMGCQLGGMDRSRIEGD
ncbi:hypothetical protein [Pseudohoeflea coraliihabitans]|uniref:Uncharacterized protein n=1 Tax=Pseudohoeflea coraliihabitans TaxID=2860393 RepID=A0ABS6WI84_9HYPH|nr:hypothetical protein [Pseudohoeflea sp. DP4N28-3]MBW3095662.1 hypothetical protein [Pseudohoeflea sp. DP4N28-3]